MTRFFLAASLGILITTPGLASIQTLDLTTNGAAGSDLDAGLPHTFAGVTLTATANGGIVNATATSLGVDVVGDGSDDSDQIDSATGEDLTFALSFAGTVFLTSLDLTGVGPAAGGDDALIFINADPAIVLKTGVTDFNGSSDVWSPAGGIALNSGDTIRFEAVDSFGLQAIAFDVRAIPEPISLFVWTAGIAACLCRRRRS